MRGKKIAGLFALVFGAVSCLSGCIPHTELDKQAIVEAIGIDYENGEYTATLQYFGMEESGGTTLVDNTKPNVITVSGKGATPSDAVEEASSRCGKPPMMGIAGVLVVGKSAAEKGLEGLMGFALSHYESNMKMLIAVAEDKAEDVMKLKFKEGTASVDKLEAMLNNQAFLGLGYSPKFYRIMDKLRQPTESAALPLLRVVDNNSDFTKDGKTAEIAGGALFREGKYIGRLSVKDMSGLQFLMDRCDTAQLTVQLEDGDVTVVLYEVKTEINPVYEEGKLKIGVKVTADGKYISSTLSDPIGAKERIEQLCEESIVKRISGAIEKAYVQGGADPADLKYSISSKEYFSWLRIEENYSEQLKNAEYSVSADVNITRFGVSGA